MPITATELIELLEALNVPGLARLPAEQLRRLSDTLYAAHTLCEMAAGERRAFPAVVRRYEPANDPAPAPVPAA